MQQSVKPGYTPHVELEKRVADYLDTRGFITDEATYHTAYRTDSQRLLMRRDDPTALYIRAKADRIALHKFRPVTFEWDAKTHQRRDSRNMALEVMPIVTHLATVPIGVRCLYAYHNPFTGFDGGFWLDTMPSVSVVFLPSRWQGQRRAWYADLIRRYFPDVTVRDLDRYGGSGDPFFLVNESDVIRLPHWQALIDAELESALP